MPFEDIAYTIFVEVLGMNMYPGNPFTGNIIRDLIMFLFIPSVFIILFVYMILGRLFSVASGAQVKLRILVGIALYLFIVAGGYYPAFALFAGPYFLFLIFILGVIYFIPHHFRFEQEGHYPERAGKHAKGYTKLGRIAYLEKEIERVEKELAHLEKLSNTDKRQDTVGRRLQELRDELFYEKHPGSRRAA